MIFFGIKWVREQQAPGARKHKFRFKNKLLSLDSTTISLCLMLFPWAKFRRAKGGVKAHVLLDHDDYLPAYVLLTEFPAHDRWEHFPELRSPWGGYEPDHSLSVPCGTVRTHTGRHRRAGAEMKRAAFLTLAACMLRAQPQRASQLVKATLYRMKRLARWLLRRRMAALTSR
jgi:hypothetical protein